MNTKQHDQRNPLKRYLGIALFLVGFLMLGMAVSGYFK